MTDLEAIRERRSVRTFDKTGLNESEKRELEAFFAAIDNPYGISIDFLLLDAKLEKLSSPVIVGEEYYLAGKMKKQAHAEEAFGFAFEKLLLHAQKMGLGSCWIAGTMDRGAFEHAAGVGQDEIMPCVSPVGRPADKMSVRENVMRKGVGAERRRPFEEIFFSDNFSTPLTSARSGPLADALKCVRLAPSAVNRQPWRVVLMDGTAHFYVRHSAGYIRDGLDLQKIDLGIALCHFDAVLTEQGVAHEFCLKDPGIVCPEGVEYVASYRID